MMPERFTADGSAALERQLEWICGQARRAVLGMLPAARLEALVLGGGYGRGQGGVLRTASGDCPYNDMEFYVFTRGNRVWNEHRFRQRLDAAGQRLSPEAGLHIEFKVDSLRRLRRAAITMFSYDLVSRHRVIWPPANGSGPADVFAGCDHHLDARTIPVAEATRLLFNRCTGLLLARELLRQPAFTSEHSDFVGRNLAKAQLALGDAVLTAAGQYHWDAVERHGRLEKLAGQGNGSSLGELVPLLDDLVRHHAAGVAFKLHPARICKAASDWGPQYADLSALAAQLWLWLENRRLNRQFHCPLEYALSPAAKCMDGPVWRNPLLNAKVFGPGAMLSRGATRYPRERLLSALPVLVWGEDAATKDLNLRRHLQHQLRTTAADWPGWVAAYKAIWPRFG